MIHANFFEEKKKNKTENKNVLIFCIFFVLLLLPLVARLPFLQAALHMHEHTLHSFLREFVRRGTRATSNFVYVLRFLKQIFCGDSFTYAHSFS